MKHVVFFDFEEHTAEQKEALFVAWRALPGKIPGLFALSCGVVADLALTSTDGVAEVNAYHAHPAFQEAAKAFLKPIRKYFVVMDYAEHAPGLGG